MPFEKNSLEKICVELGQLIASNALTNNKDTCVCDDYVWFVGKMSSTQICF